MKSWIVWIVLCFCGVSIGASSAVMGANTPAIATAKPATGSAAPASAAPAATPAPTAAPTVSGQAATIPSGAAAGSGTTTTKPATQRETTISEIMSFAPLALMLIVIFFFMSSGRKREQKKRDQMYNTMKRGSRVVTAGGLIASVVEVRDNEVVLKVDEANNIKERYTKAAIIKVLDETDTVAAKN